MRSQRYRNRVIPQVTECGHFQLFRDGDTRYAVRDVAAQADLVAFTEAADAIPKEIGTGALLTKYISQASRFKSIKLGEGSVCHRLGASVSLKIDTIVLIVGKNTVLNNVSFFSPGVYEIGDNCWLYNTTLGHSSCWGDEQVTGHMKIANNVTMAHTEVSTALVHGLDTAEGCVLFAFKGRGNFAKNSVYLNYGNRQSYTYSDGSVGTDIGENSAFIFDPIDAYQSALGSAVYMGKNATLMIRDTDPLFYDTCGKQILEVADNARVLIERSDYTLGRAIAARNFNTVKVGFASTLMLKNKDGRYYRHHNEPTHTLMVSGGGADIAVMRRY